MSELFESSPGTPGFSDLERAISSVPGVQSATVRVAPDTGRGRLRLRLVPGEDAERVSWAVAATLRERFGIALEAEDIRPLVRGADDAADPVAADLDVSTPADPVAADLDVSAPADPVAADLDVSAPADPVAADLDNHGDLDLDDPRTDPDRPPSVDELARAVADALGGLGVLDDDADERVLRMRYPIDTHETLSVIGPTTGDGARRAVIRDVTIRRDRDEVTIAAILSLDGRTVAAEATGPATADGGLRAAAEATIEALRPLTGGLLQAGIDHVTMIDGAGTAAVTVGVTVTVDRTRQELLGAAMLRDGPELAAIRATLDALNRRIAPWLVDADVPLVDADVPLSDADVPLSDPDSSAR